MENLPNVVNFEIAINLPFIDLINLCQTNKKIQ